MLLLLLLTACGAHDDPKDPEGDPTGPGEDTGGEDADTGGEDTDTGGEDTDSGGEDTDTGEEIEATTIDEALAARCPDAAWERYCLTLASTEAAEPVVRAFDLDGGDACDLATVTWPDWHKAPNLVRRGERLYSCRYGNKGLLVEIDPLTGAWVKSTTPCSGLFADGEGLVVRGVEVTDAARFATVEDAMANTPLATYKYTSLTDTRFTAHEGTVYSAWHSTGSFNTVPIDTLSGRTAWPLTDWDTWVQGLAVVDDRLLVLNDGRGPGDVTDVGLWAFPLTGGTGERVLTIGERGGGRTVGLTCTGG